MWHIHNLSSTRYQSTQLKLGCFPRWVLLWQQNDPALRFQGHMIKSAEFNTKTGLVCETWKGYQINISKSDLEGEEKMVLTCL